jgi:hypothetical protein
MVLSKESLATYPWRTGRTTKITKPFSTQGKLQADTYCLDNNKLILQHLAFHSLDSGQAKTKRSLERSIWVTTRCTQKLPIAILPCIFSSAADKEADIRQHLYQLASERQLTTAAIVASAFEVRAEQVQHLVEKERDSLSIGWHTMRGQSGTLLFPANAPVVELLHQSWLAQRRENAKLRSQLENPEAEVAKARLVQEPEILERSARIVNGMLRKEVRRHRGENFNSRERRGFEFQDFNAKREMAKIDLEQLKFFLNLSPNDAPVDAKRRSKGLTPKGSDQNLALEQSYDAERRKLRVVYAISVLVFAINPEAKHPFHLMLADVVEALGGRLALLRLLN